MAAPKYVGMLASNEYRAYSGIDQMLVRLYTENVGRPR